MPVASPGGSKRLRALIDELGTVDHFAERLTMLGYQMTPEGVYSWLGGAEIPTKAMFYIARTKAGASIDWLVSR